MPTALNYCLSFELVCRVGTRRLDLEIAQTHSRLLSTQFLFKEDSEIQRIDWGTPVHGVFRRQKWTNLDGFLEAINSTCCVPVVFWLPFAPKALPRTLSSSKILIGARYLHPFDF